MHNIIVNADTAFGIVAPRWFPLWDGRRPRTRKPVMPHKNNNNNNSGTRVRAAFALGEAARTAEMQVLARAFTLLGLTAVLFIASAPELWPSLFPGQ
jgi:hypothetical protein